MPRTIDDNSSTATPPCAPGGLRPSCHVPDLAQGFANVLLVALLDEMTSAAFFSTYIISLGAS